MSIYFSEEHEWLLVDGDTATFGITTHAAQELGDVVYIELKEVGDSFEIDEEVGVVESVKAASELYAPVDMEIIKVNTTLTDTPQELNSDAEGDAWIYKVKISEPEQLEKLMDRATYNDFIA